MSRSRKKVGLPPGSVIYTGNRSLEKIEIQYIQYDEKNLVVNTLDNHGKIIFNQSTDEKVSWYDVRGIHDTSLIEQIGNAFGIHPLIREDISDIHQRPKFEEYENGLFLIIKALAFDKKKLQVTTEQVALYFNEGTVVTFQETESDLFLHARKRITKGKGRIRLRKSDYLAYALVDVLVDNYFIVLEDIEEEIEKLEESVLETQDSKIKSRIHMLKKELLVIRKSIAPLREAISRLSKTDSLFVSENTAIYIRDLYGHTIQIMDVVESFRDLLNGLQDLFISEVSFKMNQVMQVLTIVSTIFIPLTFLAGIYGMNFENIPELHWQHGYFMLLALMFAILMALLFFFKRKNWL